MPNDVQNPNAETILKHMKLMEERITEEIHGVRQEMHGIKFDLQKEIRSVEKNLTKQLDQIDDRLQVIEEAVLDQKHEERITRLEQHVGIAA